MLSGAALNGYCLSGLIRDRIADLPAEIIDSNLDEISHIEFSIITAGPPSPLSNTILQSCERVVKQHVEDNYPLEELEATISLAFDVFVGGTFMASRELALKCLEEFPESETIINGAIRVLGVLFKGTIDEGLLGQLEVFLFPDRIDVRDEAIQAIGNISPERLNLLSSHEFSKGAFEALAQNNDWLVFDTFWVNELGAKQHFSRLPNNIVVRLDKDDDDCELMSTLIGSLLSKAVFGGG